MKYPHNNARRVLKNSIEQFILPELEKHGFMIVRYASKHPPIWVLNRPRNDGGFDVIDLIMEPGYQPRFDARINVISSTGVNRCRDCVIPAKDAMACDLPERVAIARRVFQNRTFRALARWIGIGWFGFKASDDTVLDKKSAANACREFIEILDQAELWWTTGKVGPNLINEVVGAIHR